MLLILILLAIGYLCYRMFRKRKREPEVVDDDVLKLGNFSFGLKITIKNGMVNYMGDKGDIAMIPIKQIQCISISPSDYGNSDIIITGNGSELARINAPTCFAKKAVEWMMAKLELS